MEFYTRRLGPEDPQAYINIRLTALLDTPESFARSFKEEVGETRDNIAQRLAETPDKFILGTFDERDCLVGIVGFGYSLQSEFKATGVLWGMYVLTQYRGMGVGQALIDKLLSIASTITGVEQVQLSVISTNRAAKDLYLRAGFKVCSTDRNILNSLGTYQNEDNMLLRLE